MATTSPTGKPASLRRCISPGGLAYTLSQGKWQYAPHLHLVNKILLRVAGGHVRRQILQMPVRHGKSELASVYFPLWYLMTWPWRQIILISATDDLAAEFSLRVRDLLDQWGIPLAGVRVRADRRSGHSWEVVDAKGKPTGGGMRAAGVGGGIIGRGCDLLLVDDLIRNAEMASSAAYRESCHRFFTSTAMTRLSPTGSALLIGTPWHSDDIFGRLRQAQEQGGEEWQWLRMPALSEGEGDPLGRPEGMSLWAQRFDEAWLAAKRTAYSAEGQSRYWHSLYQCRPLQGDGITSFPAEYFQGVDFWWEAFPDRKWTRTILSIDTSRGRQGSDWIAVIATRLDTTGHLWVSSEMLRLDEHRLVERLTTLIPDWNPLLTVVETNAMGYSLMGSLSRTQINGMYPSVVGREHTSRENKNARIEARVGAALAAGLLHFERSAGNRIGVEQLRDFPNADHDDFPDALEMNLELQGQLALPKANRTVKYTTPPR